MNPYIKILCCLLFCIPVSVCSQETNDHPGDIASAQLDTIAGYIDVFPDQTQLSLALLNDSVTSFLGFLKSEGGWRVVNNRDSVFETGAITKVFTSTLMLVLAEKGLLSPDEPIADVLPYKMKNDGPEDRKITFRMLSNHTSGLPRFPRNMQPLVRSSRTNPFREYDRAMLKEYLQEELVLQSLPGEIYRYSDLGAGILGYLLEMKTRKRYEDLLLEYVFARYGMTSSTTVRGNIASRLVKGRNGRGEVAFNWDFGVLKGTGALLSTTRDLSRFIRANFREDPLLARQREETFSVNENLGLAYGWHIRKAGPGGSWFWHNGATGGYRAQMVMDSQYRKGVVILSNVSGFNADANRIDQLAFSLLKTLLLYDQNND